MNWTDLKISLVSRRIRPSVVLGEHSAGKIGVILDSEEEGVVDVFLELQQHLGVENENFHFLFCRRKEDPDKTDHPVFLPKHISWNGRIKDEKVKEFVEREFDLLFCFTASENKLAAYVVSVSRAKLKIGRSETNRSEALFDLLISVKKEEPALFVREAQKYLKLITRNTA